VSIELARAADPVSLEPLDEALSAAAAEDPGTLGADVQAERMIELHRHRNRVDAEIARRVSEFDRQRLFELDAARTMASWLRHRLGMSPADASSVVRVARALRVFGATARRFFTGDLDQRRVDRLARAQQAHPKVFKRDEALLVDQAGTLSARDFDIALRYWRQAADDNSDDAARIRWERRHVSLASTWDGYVVGSLRLDAADGAVVMAAIDAITDPALRDANDRRSPGQVRADALIDICRGSLDGAKTEAGKTQRPQVLLEVDLETLEGRQGVRCELDRVGPITGEQARQILCDAGVSRIVTRGKSEILDVGRASRTVNAAQWKALVVRDRGCVAEGCDMPPRWCDAHHMVHWIDGGHSDLDNLILLCRRHHSMWHLGVNFVRAGPRQDE
jgi:hypothetical protein